MSRTDWYDLLIFDLDGTLIDSVGDIADALNAILAELSLPLHADAEVATMVGGGVEELLRRALPRDYEGPVAPLIERYRARYAQRFIGRTTLYPEVRETLNALRPTKAVATNKPGALARTIVAALELGPLFAAVLGEDDVAHKKPHPEVIDTLRAHYGAPKERTLYIGDSLVDAATAEAAGVDLCLVTYGYADPAAIRRASARYHIDRFAALQKIVAKAN